jgi:hypothetical protein
MTPTVHAVVDTLTNQTIGLLHTNVLRARQRAASLNANYCAAARFVVITMEQA